MKALISLAIIALLAFGGWKLYQYSQKYNDTSSQQQQQEAAVNSIDPLSLAGMPNGWEDSYQRANAAADNGDISALRNWLKVRGQQVEDPRRAWIELDYMVRISKQNPQEAKLIFESVKDRTPSDSPVYPRIKQLEKTYE